MYLRLLAESLRRGTRRKLLAVTAVALGILGATALAAVLLSSGDSLAAEMGAYGANLELVPGPGAETLPAARLAVLRKIFWRNNIVAVAPLLPLRVAAGERVVPLVGTWFSHPLEPGFSTGLGKTRPTLDVAGRWPDDAADEVALGRRLAQRLGLEPGDRLDVELAGRRTALTVVGVIASGGQEEEEAFAPLAVVAGLAGRPPVFARAEIFAVTTPEKRGTVRNPKAMSEAEYEQWYCTAYPSSVAYQIDEAIPEGRARVVYRIADASADVLFRLESILTALAVVALVGAGLGVTAAMTATVLERRLEAGLMIALGAARGRVAAFFLSEAGLLGLLGGLGGGLLGLAAGRLLGWTAFGVAVPWMPVLLPFAVAAGIALAVLASVAPVLRALTRYPADLLKRATA